MATERQIAANRLNARKSTGPKSEAGKAHAKLNALKSGIFAELLIVPGEDPAELQALMDGYYRDFAPRRHEERALVDNLVHFEWLLRRMRRIETEFWLSETKICNKHDWVDPDAQLGSILRRMEKSLAALQRRIDSLDRAYHRALKEIRRLQERPLGPFEQPEETEPAPAEETQPAAPQEVGAAIGFVPPIPTPPAIAPSESVPEPPHTQQR